MNIPQRNPDKWIRKEVSQRTNNIVVSGFTVPCVDYNITGNNQPLHYIEMTTQTKQFGPMTKCTGQWDCTILLDLMTRYPDPGNTGSRVLVNDIEERVMQLMNNFQIEGGFDVYRDIELESSTSFDGNTDSETYFRQLMRYRIRLIEV